MLTFDLGALLLADSIIGYVLITTFLFMLVLIDARFLNLRLLGIRGV